MKAKATRAGLCLQLAAWPVAGLAQDRLEALYPSQPDGWVTDRAGVLDPAAMGELTTRIERLRAATGAEIAVVTLPTIGDYAAVDVAVAIGRAWGVGAQAAIGDQRRNAGVVILLVPRREADPRSGHIFIATGQGIEGIVTDAAAGRVRDLMRPRLSSGDYGGALVLGVEALSAMIARGFGVTDSVLAAGGDHLAVRRGGRAPGFVLLGIIVVVILVLVLSAAASSGRRGGPPGPRGRLGPRRSPPIFLGGPGFGGGFGGFGGGFGGGGFGGFGGGGGFSGGGAGGRF